MQPTAEGYAADAEADKRLENKLDQLIQMGLFNLFFNFVIICYPNLVM